MECFSRCELADVRVEGEDDERPEQAREPGSHVEQHLQPESGLVPPCVVFTDRPHAVGPRQHREPQHHQPQHLLLVQFKMFLFVEHLVKHQ